MKVNVEQVIKDTARVTAEEIVRRQGAAVKTNHYKDMERLLRSYKVMKRLYEHPEEYTFIPPEHSPSVSVAPPSGGMIRSREEIVDEIIEERLQSYRVSCAQFRWFDATVRQFQDRPEFVVIRMYYFGEDAYGNDRPADSKRYTFEEIAEELSAAGVERSVKTLRSWRSQLVQEMTVCMFVMDGSLSIGNRELRKDEAT